MKKNNRRAFTLIKRVGQAVPDNAPVRGHLAAFTLIELLVVVLIIGILATIAVPQYQKAVMKSKLTESFVKAKAIRDAEQAYFLANGKYTSFLSELDIDLTDCTLNPNKSTTNGSITHNVYSCQQGKISIYTNAENPNALNTTYVSPFSISEEEKTLWIEFYLNNNEPHRLCHSNFIEGQQACKSIGGTDFRTGMYILP